MKASVCGVDVTWMRTKIPYCGNSPRYNYISIKMLSNDVTECNTKFFMFNCSPLAIYLSAQKDICVGTSKWRPTFGIFFERRNYMSSTWVKSCEHFILGVPTYICSFFLYLGFERASFTYLFVTWKGFTWKGFEKSN